MKEYASGSCNCRQGNRSVDVIYTHLAEANASLAMAYVPEQSWNETYELCKGLEIGTIFPCLNKPFCGKGGMCR